MNDIAKHQDRRGELAGDVTPEAGIDVNEAIEQARAYLFDIQADDGHWCGELEGDSILESEYILTMYFLGRHNEERVAKAANSIRKEQMPGGGWAIYPGGPPEVSSSVKAYWVLKLLGDDPDAEHMVRARETILRLGGIEACNSFTKLYLAIFGQIDWSWCPAIPPELILLPRWFYFNIYEMSSWSRGRMIPLSIIWAKKLVHPVPEHANIPELLTGRRPTSNGTNFWKALFYGIDQGIKLLERIPVKPSRDLALKYAARWIEKRLEGSDGLGAIFPPIVYTIFAWRALGYDNDHPVIVQQQRELEKLEVQDGDIMRIQPCFGPVWDTGLAMNALLESGVPQTDQRLQQAAHWVMSKRGHEAGDWRVKNRQVAKPGWYFEYANPYYPDNDTTAKVMTALSKVQFNDATLDRERRDALIEAHEWHLSMQNSDGGWGAFDKDCDKEILTQVPFADHNAMIDPSNEDITARILETFAQLDVDRKHPACRRAIKYLRNRQESDGSWYGRWGCNYLYGTWLALWGLRAIGEDMSSPWSQKAAGWIRSCQNDDGGWGELPMSYDDAGAKGRGPSTPSQTAWALMGLLASGDHRSAQVRQGVQYLLDRQRDDGSWEEKHWTGTGFPGVFYLRYHLYGLYFPLLALASYAQAKEAETALSRTRSA